jgi:hypothetical protein
LNFPKYCRVGGPLKGPLIENFDFSFRTAIFESR